MKKNASYLKRIAGETINKFLSFSSMRICHIEEVHFTRKISFLPVVPTIIDIGIGPQGTFWLYKAFPNAQYVLIDPLYECLDKLKEKMGKEGNHFVNCALGSHNSQIMLNICDDLGSSSFYNREEIQIKKQRQVNISRLDDIIESLPITAPFGLKIDTEGYEFEVLKGSLNTLKRTKFVIIEFHGYTEIKIDYSLQDIISFMNNINFEAIFMLKDGRNIVFSSCQK